MKLKIIVMLVIAMHSGFVYGQTQLSHDDCKILTKQCLLAAFIDQRLNSGDGDFPKRKSEMKIFGHIPTSFTTQHAQTCGRGEFNQTDAQEDELSFNVVHGANGQEGYIQITVIRAHFDAIKKAYDREHQETFWNATTAQQWFDLLQLHQLY